MSGFSTPVPVDDFIRASDWGVTGSGNDEATALQALFDYVATQTLGATIQMPRTPVVLGTTVNYTTASKPLTLVGDAGRRSVIRAKSGFSAGKLFNFSTSAIITFNGLRFDRANGADTVRAFDANGCDLNISNVYIDAMSAFGKLTSCYSSTLRDVKAVGMPGSLIEITDSGHNLSCDHIQMYSSGTSAPLILSTGRTDKIWIGDNSDIESCGTVVKLIAGGYGLHVDDTYIEGATADEFIFTVAVDNFVFENSWLASRVGGTSTWDNINAGYFSYNEVFTQTLTFGSGVSANFALGPWTNAGSGVIVDRPLTTNAARRVYGEFDANGTNQAYTASASVTVTLSTARHNTGLSFASNAVTVPHAGKYRVSGQVLMVSSTTGAELVASIYLNGAAIKGGNYAIASTGNGTSEVNSVLNLAASDVLTLHASCSANGTIWGATPNTFLTVEYLGP